ncbi:recombinase family protein [Pseudomonas aeruginosa]
MVAIVVARIRSGWPGTVILGRFIPERVEAVRFALDAYRSGIGAARLVRLMHEKGMVLSDWGIAAQQVYRLVRLPALRGAKRISIDGEDFMLEDYYPRLLSDEEFSELETLVGQRYRRRGKDEIVGIVTGIGITRCGYCGTALVAQNLMQRVKSDGSLEGWPPAPSLRQRSKNGGCNGGAS